MNLEQIDTSTTAGKAEHKAAILDVFTAFMVCTDCGDAVIETDFESVADEIIKTLSEGGASDSYELSLAASLRQLAQAQWTLSNEPMPEDARQVLFNAAGMLAMNRSLMDAGHATIQVQSQFIEAMGNEMRAAGCDFNPASGKVVNTLADKIRADLAGEGR